VLSNKEIRYIYSLTNDTAFTGFDCGTLCDRACCQGTDQEMGIYLLPGEEIILNTQPWLQFQYQEAEDYDFPPSWNGPVVFAHCRGNCTRHLRPMQCRTFPAAPHLKDDKLILVRETIELPYVCPLSPDALNSQYLANLYLSWQLLMKDYRIKDLVIWDSKLRLEDNLSLKILYSASLLQNS